MLKAGVARCEVLKMDGAICFVSTDISNRANRQSAQYSWQVYESAAAANPLAL
jgi:hypothetical protein